MDKPTLSVPSKIVPSLFVIIGTGGLVVLLFWILEIFHFSYEEIRDIETADVLSGILQRGILHASLALLLSTGIIWIVSFQKKLGKPFLTLGLVAAGILTLAALLARVSDCEGLGCIGPALIFYYSLLALVFLASSIGFILLLKISGSARLVRGLSTLVVVIFGISGLLFYQYATSTIQRTAEHNLSTAIDNLSSKFALFTPSYLPNGVMRKIEKVQDFNATYQQFYWLEEGFISIEQSKPQGRFEEYERYLHDVEVNADKHIEEITIDGTRAIFSLTFPYYSNAKPIGGGLIFTKDGTEIEISLSDNNSIRGEVVIREEVINIAKSLKPR